MPTGDALQPANRRVPRRHSTDCRAVFANPTPGSRMTFQGSIPWDVAFLDGGVR